MILIDTNVLVALVDERDRLARHEPDLCDAMLVAAATQQRCAIWTYDTEFTKLWRSLEGKALKVAGSAEKVRRRKRARP